MSSYSVFTIRNYECRIRRIKLALSFTDDDIFTKPDEVIAHISSLDLVSNMNCSYNAIKWLIKGKVSADVYNKYNEAHSKIKEPLKKQVQSQTISEKREEQFLQWPQVLELAEKPEFQVLSDLEQIVYYLYTLMPPVRADFVDMKVIAEKDYNNMLTICPNMNEYNWCLLNNFETPVKFIFNKYKTHNAYGQVVLDIPAKLGNELHSYRIGKDKEFELLSISTENALCKQVQRIFEKLSGKRMSIGLLRHSYIQHFLSVKRKLLDRKELSRQMMHSIETQECYDIMSY